MRVRLQSFRFLQMGIHYAACIVLYRSNQASKYNLNHIVEDFMKCFGPKNIKKLGVFLAKGSRCLGQRMVEDLNSRKLLLILSMMKITTFCFCHFIGNIFWKILIFFHFHKCSNTMKKMRCFRAISDNFKWVKWTNTFNPIKKNTL